MEDFVIPPPPQPVEQPIRSVKHITEMTEEELEKILGDDKKARASYEECIKNDGYNCKRDRCKEMREKKEKDKQEKENLINMLSHRNQMLEKHARQLEEEVKLNKKDFSDYKTLSEKRFEKLTNLFLSLSK